MTTTVIALASAAVVLAVIAWRGAASWRDVALLLAIALVLYLGWEVRRA